MSLRPFFWIGGFWVVGAIAVTAALLPSETPASVAPALWTGLLGALCLLDLFALSRVIAVVLALVSDNHSGNKSAWMAQAAFWGTVKLLCLGLIVMALSRSRDVPTVAVLSGLSALLAVPLLGGFVWSQRELKNVS